MVEKKAKGKTGHSSDQWFKIKNKVPKQQRGNIKKKHRKQQKEEGRKQSGQTSKFEDERQTTPTIKHWEEEGTNFPKVIGWNKFVSLKLSHS